MAVHGHLARFIHSIFDKLSKKGGFDKKDTAERILDAILQVEQLEDQYFHDPIPDNDAYEEQIRETRDFLEKLRFPKLAIPRNRELALVSIVLVDPSAISPGNIDTIETFNFLVDKKHAYDFAKVGENALWYATLHEDFFIYVCGFSYAEIVKMYIFRHSIEYGIPVYMEFSNETASNLYQVNVEQQ